jgi:hypothetical protein
MLARSRSLHLTPGPLSSPLLVPSVSSKGFPLQEGVSEAAHVLGFVSQDLQEALLISGYDLHHELLLDVPQLLGPDYAATLYVNPELLIVDSGGYELAGDFESGEVNRGPRIVETFGSIEYASVVDRLSPDLAALIVSFDEPHETRGNYRDQRIRAQTFFAERPHFKSDFLLKPEPGSRYIDVGRLTPEIPDFRVFDVIGVTEKELGRSLIDRLVALAKLRSALDDAGITSPIHVFGALDPLVTPLYFMVGGEIFDGLSWIRYAYHDGVAVHQDALTVLLGNMDDDDRRRDARRHISNLSELQKLKHSLEKWAHDPSRFDVLGSHSDNLREIYETVAVHLARKG